METDSGIVGMTAGTKVTFVRNKGQKMVVSDGQSEVEVTQDQLTNDLDVAAAVLKKTQEQDAAVAASVHAQQDIVRKAQEDQAAGIAREHQWEAERAAAAAEAAAATPTPAPAAESAPGMNRSSSSTGTPPPFGRMAPP